MQDPTGFLSWLFFRDSRRSPGWLGKCAQHQINLSGMAQRPIVRGGQRQNGFSSNSASFVCSEGDLWEGSRHWSCNRKLTTISNVSGETLWVICQNLIALRIHVSQHTDHQFSKTQWDYHPLMFYLEVQYIECFK